MHHGEPNGGARSLLPVPIRWLGLLLFETLSLAGASAAERVDPLLVPSIFSPESTPAHAITHLAGLVLAITAGIFVVVAGLLTFALVRFRRQEPENQQEPPQVYGSGPIEIAWTTVPLLIVLVLTLCTARVIHEVQDMRKPAGALEVQVIGHQWWWEIRYPSLRIVTANEIHVPVSEDGKRLPTFLDLRSADVVHSFWVPRLAGKMDLIPNKVNSMWIEPERTGLFVGQCAEYCGTQHALMLLRVYVDTPEDFQRWVREQRAPARADVSAAAGRAVFEQTACVNCHTVRGTIADGRFGPDLTHLMSRDTLGSGAVNNSIENLRAWIRTPDRFKPGVLMPAMNLGDTEVNQVAHYLATLR
jgi:cytochrome c oxidase subunit 2